jgi:DegV family protein with EDD domain
MFKIITDTNSGLTVKDAEGLGLVFVPQITIIGGKSYREGYELSFEQLAEMMPKLPELPTTAAFPVGEYIKIFEKLSAEKTPALLISESAGVSGTFVAASTALKEVPQADIHIVDTRTIGPGLGTLVRLAVKWEKEGLSRDEVEKRVGEMAKREKIFFLVATLENLKRGGRIGGAKALLGSVLQVKPILTIVDGVIQPLESQRTHRKAVERLKELAIQFYRNGAEHINIAHSATEVEVLQVKADLEKALGISNIPTMNVPPAILIHVGAGAIAVSAFKKP